MELFYLNDYVPWPQTEDMQISIEYWDRISDIPKIKGKSYPVHRHHYYELALIQSGFCKHTYKNSTISLIPGDCFLIPADEYHAYQFEDNLHIYNCQFYTDSLKDDLKRILKELSFINLVDQSSKFLALNEDLFSGDPAVKSFTNTHSAFVNQQGIIHLNQAQQFYMESILNQMKTEQTDKKYGSHNVMQNYLEILFYELYRIKINQYNATEKLSSKKKQMVTKTLEYIDNNIRETIDFNMIAESYGLSPNYFRTIFREITGISPTLYLNRTRILKALELLRTTSLPIVDIAAEVGIYDANYFTRLFRKQLGYSPKYFKNID
ncbi:AraC family transcriptional regulator [Ruminococcus gauvreauii]|uniref:AraC family transcriptional regulator n=1 Tax=Ruminococcus gauvreauii TaxID=438033 RepID=UPI003983EE46